MDFFVCIKLIVKAQIMLDANKLCEINKLSIHRKHDLLFKSQRNFTHTHTHIATPEVIYLQVDAIIQV